MLYIAHRGNLYGPNISCENEPSYIQNALDLGYDVEIDVWVKEFKIYLGHDQPQYEINIDFLKNNKLWCHAKNFDALNLMYENRATIHYFSHDLDSHILTSKNIIWAYPGKEINNNTVCVMPERTDDIYTEQQLKSCYGICSDYVGHYKKKLTAEIRLAMIISGRGLRYESNLLEQLNKFYNKFTNVWIDIYVSINGKQDEYYNQMKKVLFPCKIRYEDYICPDNYKNYKNARNEAIENPTITYNMLSHYYNNMKCLEMIKMYCHKNNFEYDRCFQYRTDIVTDELPKYIMDNLNENTVYYSKYLYILNDNNELISWNESDKINNAMVINNIICYILSDNIIIIFIFLCSINNFTRFNNFHRINIFMSFNNHT